MNKPLQTKFVFITGGIISSLGKGVAAASVGAILKSSGYKIGFLKSDPYINVDPGTMNPFQHGEVFITKDGTETDLDLGHYERFTGQEMSRWNNFTAGQVYDTVMKKERKGDFLGKTVQVIPHITDEIKSRIFTATKDCDIFIVEIGGTVGDIESLPFLEAIRQIRFELESDQIFYIHMTLIPWIKSAQELKTKPTQHSVNKLREIGIQPDMLICRSAHPLTKELKDKIAMFTNVQPENVITGSDAEWIYEIPLLLAKEGIHKGIFKKFFGAKLKTKEPNLKDWKKIVQKFNAPKKEVRVGIVGKYLKLRDAYKSLFEALEHAAIHQGLQLKIVNCDPEFLEKKKEKIPNCDGFLVPGGFGKRGSEGKILYVKHAREKQIPFFGICYGFQMAIIEYARNVVGLKEVHSVEISPNAKIKIIEIMAEQKKQMNLGGTMRLGETEVEFSKNSKIAQIYGCLKTGERHRHRFEMNNEYIQPLKKKGMVFSGFFADSSSSKEKKTSHLHLIESIELPKHPWFVAVQYHPEFNSSPFKPHPLFTSFMKTAAQRRH